MRIIGAATSSLTSKVVPGEEARVLLAADAGEFAVGAGGIVAAAGDLPGNFRPGRLELGAIELGKRFAARADRERVVVDDFADEMADAGQARFAHHFGNAGDLGRPAPA